MLFCAGAIISANSSNAQSVIYYWNFNNTAPASTDTFKPFINAIGSAAHFAYHCAYIDYVTPGDALNLQPADTAGSAIRFRNPSDSAVFFMPTNGFKNVKLSYSVMRTGSGAQTNQINYSTDGVTFKPVCATDATDSCNHYIDVAFVKHSFDFSLDAATQNNAFFAVSIAFQNGNTNASGNDRYDNITLTGTVLPGLEVINQAEVATSYILYPNPVSNNLQVAASADGEKTFAIYNVMGQKVYDGVASTQNFSVNTSSLNPGIYSISIRENKTGAVKVSKFTKG